MNPRPFSGSAIATILAWAVAASSLFLGGCMTSDATAGGAIEGGGIDPFPKPLGEAIIPLEKETYSEFKYVEFDSAGGLVLRQDLPLHIIPREPGIYGYAFEKTSSGNLLTFKDGGGNRDSAGIYILGTFRDSASDRLPAPVLWLPQFPKPGIKWSIAPGREMELVKADTVFFTGVLFTSSEQVEIAPIRYGFQKQPTLLFRETYGDTLTYYFFRRGVGCLGFERSAGGKLIATGIIQTFGSRAYGGFYE